MEVYKYLPYDIYSYIKSNGFENDITEIRLRCGMPMQLNLYYGMITAQHLVSDKSQLWDIFYNMCQQSVNIYDNDISNGFITLSDGCRVGIGGEFCCDKTTGRYTLKQLYSLNIRISRDKVQFENQYLLDGFSHSTLIIGPPHSGKTSLLKLLAEKLSTEHRVVICDERKELHSNKLNCDVLQGINKADAVLRATRTLNPQFVICDEIGTKEEAEQILSAVNSGVKFICSAHGENLQQVLKRPAIKLLADSGIFDKYMEVCQQNRRFYIKGIYDA